MGTGLAECLPLGILQVIYIHIVPNTGILETLSLITTFYLLGSKFGKISELPKVHKYHKKQRRKSSQLEATATGNTIPDVQVRQPAGAAVEMSDVRQHKRSKRSQLAVC